MARLFDDALSEFLEYAAAPVSAYPFTMACWFNSDDVAATQVLMSVGDTASADSRHRIQASGAVAGDPVRAVSSGSAAATTTGYSANTWHHACGVFTGDASRAAFIDGGSKGTNTGNFTVSSLNSFKIGEQVSSTGGIHFSGRIAEAAIWNVALTDTDVAALAKALSPLLVRPEALVTYWPLIGRYSTEIDLVGGFGLTPTGTVVSAHPRIIYPKKRHPYSVVAGEKYIKIKLVTSPTDSTPRANLTALRYAFWDNATVNGIAAAPVYTAANGTTDALGFFTLEIPLSALTDGQVGYLVVTDSDGTINQDPVAKGFAGPVVIVDPAA